MFESFYISKTVKQNTRNHARENWLGRTNTHLLKVPKSDPRKRGLNAASLLADPLNLRGTAPPLSEQARPPRGNPSGFPRFTAPPSVLFGS
jgi:hypothetical protein